MGTRLNVLDFARLSAQVLRLPRRAREDLHMLLEESLAEKKERKKPKAEKKEGAE